MEISRLDNYANQIQANQSASDVGRRAAEDAKSVQAKDADRNDQVRLSQGYQEIHQAKKVMLEQPDIRVDKVNEIRNQIASNTYQIDPGQIASMMLQSGW